MGWHDCLCSTKAAGGELLSVNSQPIYVLHVHHCSRDYRDVARCQRETLLCLHSGISYRWTCFLAFRKLRSVAFCAIHSVVAVLLSSVCVGCVTLELWVIGGTCSWIALLLQISETSTLHWLQSAQVSWLGLCGPKTNPWLAGTSLLASIECQRERERISLVHSASIGL